MLLGKAWTKLLERKDWWAIEKSPRNGSFKPTFNVPIWQSIFFRPCLIQSSCMRRRAFKQWARTCSLGLGTWVTNKVPSISQHFSKAMIGQNSQIRILLEEGKRNRYENGDFLCHCNFNIFVTLNIAFFGVNLVWNTPASFQWRLRVTNITIVIAHPKMDLGSFRDSSFDHNKMRKIFGEKLKTPNTLKWACLGMHITASISRHAEEGGATAKWRCFFVNRHLPLLNPPHKFSSRTSVTLARQKLHSPRE